MEMNKFNIGDKVWFKLDSYGKKAERCGTICSSILCDPESGWQYNIETGDHKHWNIPEKDINYTAPHIRERDKEHVEESVTDFLNRIYGNPDFKPEVNKEDNKMKNQQKKRNRNIIRVKRDCPSEIKEVMFNGPATIIKWRPTNDSLFFGDAKGEKTVVVCKDDEQNMTVGFLLAVVKGLVDNQSYDNILRKIDSFSSFDIPKIEKEKIFNELDKAAKEWNHINTEEVKKKDICDPSYKFQVGDIVRLKHGKALFKVLKQSYWKFGPSKRVVNRYRIQSLNANSKYTTYEVEKRLELVKRGE